MHWYEDIASTLGRSYLRYSFTRGTANEVDFLVDVLGLGPGSSVLDVGCGPGRHANDLARRGCRVVGVDVSERFLTIAREDAPAGAEFRRLDARELDYDEQFDAVISICQGAFGLQAGPMAADPDGDALVMDAMARAARPGARLAVTAFSAYFQVRHLEVGERFDTLSGVVHERTELTDESGVVHAAEHWTTGFTPRELRLLARRAGLVPEVIHGVTPGDFARRVPGVDHPEFLMIAGKPI